MVVCYCNGISDTEIRRTVRRGASSLNDVARICGAGACCGGCHQAVAEIIDEIAPLALANDDSPAILIPPAAASAS